jgi:hypothetical protein
MSTLQPITIKTTHPNNKVIPIFFISMPPFVLEPYGYATAQRLSMFEYSAPSVHAHQEKVRNIDSALR